MQLHAVLGVGMDDVILQVVNRLHGIVAGDHHEVRRVEVDGHAGGMQAVEEVLERQAGFGAGFDGEVRVETVGIGGQLAARVQQNAEARMLLARGHHADVRGDDAGFKLLRQIQNALGALDQLGILLRIVEAVSKIAAQRGDHEPAILHGVQEIAALLAGQVLGRHFAARGVHLHALRAQTASDVQRLGERFPEGIQNDANRELVHDFHLIPCIFPYETIVPHPAKNCKQNW